MFGTRAELAASNIDTTTGRRNYIAATDVTFTNRSDGRHAAISVYLQITHGRGTLLMYAPEAEIVPDWRQTARIGDRPNSVQLIFPLDLPPKTSAGGHILFFIDDKEKSIVGDTTFPKPKHLEVEELSSHERRLFPVTATIQHDAAGTRLV